jgi:hypothetical protein
MKGRPMAVTLRKGIHRWVYFMEENVTFCRNCGTVLDAGQSPFSVHCTSLHDRDCVCNRCREFVNG